nr:hypothetical protein [Tanacetum cinerariifolium]
RRGVFAKRAGPGHARRAGAVGAPHRGDGGLHGGARRGAGRRADCLAAPAV